jgi:hypothetical protein
MQKKYIVYYFPAVLLLIPNISSGVNWGVPQGLHKIAPVSLSLTASIYRAHKLGYVPSLYFYTPWVWVVKVIRVTFANQAFCRYWLYCGNMLFTTLLM